MKKYNLIFLLIDGARVDRLSQFKIFEEMKKKCTFFSNMITHAPYTLVSMNSIFTGMYGGRNGINAYYKLFQHPKKECKTLAEYLSENGWYSQGDAMRLNLVSNRGFSKMTQQEENVDFVKVHSDILEEILNTKKEEQQFFAYLHYPKIHHQIKENVFDKYDDFSKEYFANKSINLTNYDRYLKEASSYLEKIYDKIINLDLEKNSLIVIMADHGMGVGEKFGERAYGVYLYDYSLRTFAYFINEKLFPQGKVVEELTRTIDIMPTILDIFEIPIDKSCMPMQGESLVRLTKDSNKHEINNELTRFAFAETGGLKGPWPSPNSPNVKCVRTQKWKLIHNLTPDTWELYHLEDDPNEENNLINKEPQIVTKLKETLNVVEERNAMNHKYYKIDNNTIESH